MINREFSKIVLDPITRMIHKIKDVTQDPMKAMQNEKHNLNPS